MSSRVSVLILLVACGAGFGVLQAAGESQQQAESFSRKMALVTRQGASSLQAPAGGARRTPFSEAELNSWFVYQGRAVLPEGVTEPRVSIVGNGKVAASATVDLEAVARRRATGRTLDPWSYLSGRLPVTMSGVLHTKDGVGRFDLEEARISGVPVPTSLLQDVVSYYSRSTDEPEGVRLDTPFRLPARIRQIEVGQGQAVVVQ